MKYILISLAFMASMAVAEEPIVEDITVKCSWGEFTASSIADGFDQGPHSADPSGDGKGKGDADSPRKGLANVIDRGNLQLTCEFLKDLIDNG